MRLIRLNGYIDDESWFGDEITPAGLHDELYPPDADSTEDIRIILNSYGGSCNAATQMYDEIKAYPGRVHLVISGTAASAATVVAMAADRLEITPGSLFMCHDPVMAAYGNEADLADAMEMLRVCKASIINIYQQRSYHTWDEISDMMRATTWMDANQAMEEGFVDAVLTDQQVFGVLNAAVEHVVDVAEASAKYENWLNRRRPVKRDVDDMAPSEQVPEDTAAGEEAPEAIAEPEPEKEQRFQAAEIAERLNKLRYNY